MARLKIIGAGHIRTGTDSLRLALNQLGYNTHHMAGMVECDRGAETFTTAYLHPEQAVNWDALYYGFDAACDWPTEVFVERLMKAYSEAKAFPTGRTSESWYESVKNTALVHMSAPLPDSVPEHIKKNATMMRIIVLDRSRC